MHGMRWEHPRGSCERMLYLNGIWFADFCCAPGHHPLQYFVLNTPEGPIKTPPSVKQTKRIAEQVARRWRRRFRYWNWKDPDDDGDLLIRAYEQARTIAALETQSPLSTCPDEVPWTVEQILDKKFFPK
jgi:uncharacterized protein DUF29